MVEAIISSRQGDKSLFCRYLKKCKGTKRLLRGNLFLADISEVVISTFFSIRFRNFSILETITLEEAITESKLQKKRKH